jgi:PhnB protein
MSSITIHMIVSGADRASRWYQDVFDAHEHGRITLPDGRLIHVALHVGDAALMLADEFPEHGALIPPPEIASAIAFYLQLDDVDAVWARALSSGGIEHRALQDTAFGEREGQIVDPFGYRWGLTQHLYDVPLDAMSRAAAQMLAS